MLDDSSVFGNQFRSFTRSGTSESWYLLTYEIDGIVYKSNPIQLRNISQPTVYTNDVTIDFPESLKPRFIWDNSGLTNTEYLHVLLNSSSEFVSGVYTQNTTFEYFDTSTTTSQISTTAPDLILENRYNCTILGFSNENWVNLNIQKSFDAE